MEETRKLLGNFEKILKNFDENSIEKLYLYLYFYFVFIFNFIFHFIFRKFVTKNRAFANNTIFLQQFFRFRGDFPLSPWLHPCQKEYMVECMYTCYYILLSLMLIIFRVKMLGIARSQNRAKFVRSRQYLCDRESFVLSNNIKVIRRYEVTVELENDSFSWICREFV